MVLRRSTFLLLVTLSSASFLVASAGLSRDEGDGAPMIRDGFETPRPVWRQEQTDALIQLQTHERTNRAAHEGRLSERFQFQAGAGSSFYYSYPLPKITVTDDLRVDLFVRSNRAGVRLSGRVVLPTDTDPDTGQPSFVMVQGTSYENVGRWQRIELAEMRPAIERQARVLRAATRRPVSLDGAYLERLVVNLFGGAGETEVFLDELAVGPVSAAALASRDRPEPVERPAQEVAAPKAGRRDGAKIELVQNHLHRKFNGGDFDWVFTAIDAAGADVVKLRNAGFDVLAEEVNADPARVREALRWGFLIMPDLDATLEGRPIEANEMVDKAVAYPFRDSVAFWNLGDHLGRARDAEARKVELDRIRDVIVGLRKLPEGVSRLSTATVDGDLALFASPPRNLSIVGIRPNIWGSSQDATDSYLYLKQRRDLTALANPEGLFFTWLPATPPPVVRTAIWGYDAPPPWGVPRIQPEQLRLSTYFALAAGYRGVGFRADSGLTGDSGRSLLIEMALLNEEIDLCESILGNGTDPIPLYYTYLPDPPILPPPGSSPTTRLIQRKEMDPHPEIRAAGISTRDRRGVLLLVANYSPIAQFQPSQMAVNDLKITVPAPESAQAWEISPGQVRVLERERVPGGTRITLPDFGTTALVLVTTDVGLAERMEAAIRRVRPLAVQMAIEQARIQHRWVADVNDRILAMGHTLYDKNDQKRPPLPAGSPEPHEEADLLHKSEEAIKAAQEALEREDYELAWSEARRAGRPLRHLMTYQWAKAVDAYTKVVAPEAPPLTRRHGRQTTQEYLDQEVQKRAKTPNLVSPVCCPPLVSYATLPLFDYWLHWIRSDAFGRNLVPSGSFDDHTSLESTGWINQSYQYEGVTSKVLTVPDERDKTKRLLKLSVSPADRSQIDALPPFLDFPAAAIRSPAIRVERDEFYRITVLLRKDIPNPPGAGGIVITDSLGGEPFQFRSSNSIPKLSKLVLYRYAPARGVLTVTLGLAGFGEAYFDDFRVERLEGKGEGGPDHYAGPSPVRRRAGDPAPKTAGRPPRYRTSQ